MFTYNFLSYESGSINFLIKKNNAISRMWELKNKLKTSPWPVELQES